MNDPMPEHLRLAFARAADYAVFDSDDPVTRNGAVLLDRHNRSCGGGANSFVTRHSYGGSGRNPSEWHERVKTDKPFKYAVMCHAECNAIAAARQETAEGGKLVALYASCTNCAKAIVAAGVVEVHTLSDSALGGVPARWREEVDLGLMILRECGVAVTHWDAPATPLRYSFLFDGRQVHL